MANEKRSLDDCEYYLNRELSLLHFNERVLAQAQDKAIPLLERLNYLFICASNLDEFFEVRVAQLKQKMQLGLFTPGPDGIPGDILSDKISELTHNIVKNQYKILNKSLLPLLEKKDIYILSHKQWSKKQSAWVKQYFLDNILPLLSPVALDLAHPFPKLVNKSLNFIVMLKGKDAFGRGDGLAIVHAPRALPRLLPFPEEIAEHKQSFAYLSTVIKKHVKKVFPGMTVDGCYQFRLTRNSDVWVDENETEDLPKALQQKLQSRRYGDAVRLEIVADCPQEIADFLLKQHNLKQSDLYMVNGPVNLSRYRSMIKKVDCDKLKFPALEPSMPKDIVTAKNIFDLIRQKDIVLAHPYQSFLPVLNFIHQAATDDKVLAIKTTLYRTGANSQMVKALIEAARNGKEVTAVIELRARFDEAFNIELANALQEAGALVVYGVIGVKTHAKMTLILRKEKQVLQQYVHVSTGNYHAGTAKQYTDYGLFSFNKEITDDVRSVFQQLTGMSQLIKLKKLYHAPFTLHSNILKWIEKESRNAALGKPARIIAKMNALTDEAIIRALYRASQAGVKIDLIIRGICCLRPGIKKISENIRVYSVVGRFLEHSRIYYFSDNGKEKLYCASADWMERNMFHRVELCFPVQSQELLNRIKAEALLLYLQDNCQRFELKSNGEYKRLRAGDNEAINAQQVLLQRYQGQKAG